MRRRLLLLGFALLSACRAPAGGEAARQADQDGWTRPPAVLSATVRGDALVVGGLAEPAGRVVLKGGTGDAYATAADQDGRFRIAVPLVQAPMMLTLETQLGQDSAASAERLLVLEGGRGPIALLRSGASAIRQDGANGLGAIDGDGRVVLLSGQGPAPAELTAGERVVSARSEPSGGWTAAVDLPAGASVRVGEQTYVWPGAATVSGEPFAIARTPGGWRIVWSGSPGDVQTTWLPDRR